MFLWSARTLANAVREHMPETAPLLETIAAAYGTPKFEAVFHDVYPKCENIQSITPCWSRALPRASICLISTASRAEFSWNDLGSWASLYEYQLETRLRGDSEGNVTIPAATWLSTPA